MQSKRSKRKQAAKRKALYTDNVKVILNSIVETIMGVVSLNQLIIIEEYLTLLVKSGIIISEKGEYILNPLYTGFNDDNYKPIFVGDRLLSKWKYEVIVVKDEYGVYVGKLVCDEDHTCANIPYSIYKGKGHIKL